MEWWDEGIFSFSLSHQEKKLTGFITDFLQEAYIPVINGEGFAGVKKHSEQERMSQGWSQRPSTGPKWGNLKGSR